MARSQGNYAGVEDIAADCRAKFGADTVALTFPILSRNRIAICLKGIAKAFKKVYILSLIHICGERRMRRSAGNAPRSGARYRTAFWTIFWRAARWTCLLYTSRCV